MRHLLVPATIIFLAAFSLSAQSSEQDCVVPMQNWQPKSKVREMAQSQGWTVKRIKIDDGCYEVIGKDASGQSIEVRIDPATLSVLEIETTNHLKQEDESDEEN